MNSIIKKEGIRVLRDWGMILFLSFMALAGNIFRVEMFFNVDFLFGGIFVMLAVKYYGKRGIVAGFLASLYTYYLWNHPYAVIIFTAEAAFAAYLLKEGRDIILIDLLYWFSLGAGIIFVTYNLIMGMGLYTTTLIMLKQSINGIFNTLGASLIYYGINYYRKSTGKSHRQVYIRHVFFKLLVVTAAVPALLYVIFSVRHHSQDMSEDFKKQIISMHDAAGASVDSFFTEADMQTAMLAKQSENGVTDNAEMEKLIISQLNSSDIFRGMAYVNKDFSSELIFMKKDGEIRKISGIDFSSRNYFGEASGSKGMFLTDMHNCDGSGMPDIITAVRTVRNSRGEITGYIHGGIDSLELKKNLFKLSSDSGVQYTMTDREGRIVFSTDAGYDGAKRYADRRAGGNAKDIGGGVTLWSPRPEKNVSVMTRWKNSYYIKAGFISDRIPYKLISEMPFGMYVEKANSEGFSALAIIMGMIIVSVFSAWLFSRRVAFHITRLADNTAYLPEKVSRNEKIEWESSVFAEVSRLMENFRTMGGELADSFARLKMQADELNLVLNAIPLVIFVKDTRNNIILGNRAAAECFGYAQEKMVNLPVSELMLEAEKYYNDDLTVIRTGQPLKRITQTYKTVNGVMNVLTDKIPMLGKGGVVESILVISMDITEELKLQEEKARTIDALYQQSKMAEMGAMIGAITHQWKQPLNSIGLLAQMIQSDIEDKTSTDESVQDNIAQIMDNVRFMSQTVSDFAGFYKTDKEMTVFRACETMQEIYSLLDRQFVKAGIEVVFHEHKHFDVYGLKNEFKQVCLNILTNAKDALTASDIKSKRIDVRYARTLTEAVITVRDNGGGIPHELLPDRLFEINTTTKNEGTGVGLYICRTIVEGHMGGKITAGNTEEGAEITISLPLHNTLFS